MSVGFFLVVLWFGIAVLTLLAGKFWLFVLAVAVFVAVLLIALGPDFESVRGVALWSRPTLVVPSFTLSAVIGISVPLFIITMASQNITGMAVLSTFGFKPDAGSMFRWTGAFSLLAAPFGSHAVNLAAITAAICAGDEAHPEPSRRYWSAVVAGIAYVGWGLTAAVAVSFISVSPPILIEAVAGLALLGALAASLVAALSVEANRIAALIAILVTASGVTFFGISGAFWGLLAGGALYLWDHRRNAAKRSA